jgi:hypothetical protein
LCLDRTAATTATPESASEQILRKLRASHDNLRAVIEEEEAKYRKNDTLGQDECQVRLYIILYLMILLQYDFLSSPRALARGLDKKSYCKRII